MCQIQTYDMCQTKCIDYKAYDLKNCMAQINAITTIAPSNPEHRKNLAHLSNHMHIKEFRSQTQ